MTMTDVNIKVINSNNLLPIRLTTERIASGTKAIIGIQGVQTHFNIDITPVSTITKGSFVRLAEILPKCMSTTHIRRLRSRFPQKTAAEDPATHEFETP